VDTPSAVVGKNDQVLPATLLQRVFHKTIAAYNVALVVIERRQKANP